MLYSLKNEQFHQKNFKIFFLNMYACANDAGFAKTVTFIMSYTYIKSSLFTFIWDNLKATIYAKPQLYHVVIVNSVR